MMAQRTDRYGSDAPTFSVVTHVLRVNALIVIMLLLHAALMTADASPNPIAPHHANQQQNNDSGSSLGRHSDVVLDVEHPHEPCGPLDSDLPTRFRWRSQGASATDVCTGKVQTSIDAPPAAAHWSRLQMSETMSLGTGPHLSPARARALLQVYIV